MVRRCLSLAVLASLLSCVVSACSLGSVAKDHGSRPASAPAVSAWIVGGAGAIWHTSDGGTSWQRQLSNTTERLDGVAFCDSSHGFAVGWNGTILATTDGGTHWLAQSSAGLPLWRVVCVDPKHAWALGPAEAGATLAQTSDGGAVWHEHLIRGTPLGLYDGGLAFADATHGWLVSGNAIRFTSDGGATWTVQYRAHPGSLLKAVACSNQSHVWAVGTHGPYSFPLVLATTNGGASWVSQHVGPPGEEVGSGLGLVAVTCADSEYAWAVGLDNLVAETTNGGRSWQLGSIADGYALSGLAIACADSHHVLMTTSDQPVMVTTNGGRAWSFSGSSDWLPDGPAQGIAAVLVANH